MMKEIPLWQDQAASRISIMIDSNDDVIDINEIPVGAGIKSYLFDDVDADVMDFYKFFGFPTENTSHQLCSPMPYFNCADDKPLWWLVLRWVKMMLLKIARSYHAKPLILVIFPLLVGLAIGFLFGRKWQSEKSNEKRLPRVSLFNRFSESSSIICCNLLRISNFRSHAFSFFTKITTEQLVSDSIIKQSDEIENAKNDDLVSDKVPLRRSQISNSIIHSDLETREATTRTYIKSDEGTLRESGVPVDRVPRHIAVIMDGNRRYGKHKYGSATRGHWDGSSKLVEFAKWCIAERIAVLTVFAFSSDNWKRDATEVASLMQIFSKYCDELRVEALKRNIKIVALSTDCEKIPQHVQIGVKRMVDETVDCDGMILNICLSYGSRDEIVTATKSVVKDVVQNNLDPDTISEKIISQRLLTHNSGGDPDVLIRTSGEVRISNFLLWQLAYTEFFFIDKPWPAVEKTDLLQVIRGYVDGRNRRYGK